MKISDILEEIGDEEDLIEQLTYNVAAEVTLIYNAVSGLSADFTLMPDDKDIRRMLISTAIKVILYRQKVIKVIGPNSNSEQRIEIVLDYITKLREIK